MKQDVLGHASHTTAWARGARSATRTTPCSLEGRWPIRLPRGAPRRCCALLAALCASTACRGAPVDDGVPTVKLVSSLVRTGSANAQTSHIVRGIRLALAGRQGTVAGVRVRYEDWDDASTRKGDWDPEVEAANAARAVRDARVLAYIGPYNSGAAKISAPILNRAGLASISPVVTYPGLTKAGVGEPHEPVVYRPGGRPTFFRVVPPDDVQGEVGAAWMAAMGGRRVYVLDDLQLYGRGVADVFVRAARRQGLQVVGRESVDAKAQEYRSLMAKVRSHAPDWVYYGGTTQTNAGQIIKDAVAMGVTANIMLPDGCFEEAMIDAAGPQNADNRVFLTFGGVPPEALTGAGAAFVRQYEAAYGMRPDVYAVYGFVAADAALGAIEHAAGAGALNRAGVLQALAETQRDAGPLGPWHFDAQGDISVQTMSGNVVRDGAFAFVTLLDAVAAAPPSATPASPATVPARPQTPRPR